MRARHADSWPPLSEKPTRAHDELIRREDILDAVPRGRLDRVRVNEAREGVKIIDIIGAALRLVRKIHGLYIVLHAFHEACTAEAFRSNRGLSGRDGAPHVERSRATHARSQS